MARAFKSVAIVGGGPGGLVLAKLLDDFPDKFVRTTIFEASPRLGGKVLTRSFGSTAAIFEAGVAELYDYSHLGQDPLKELVVGLDLETIPMTGRTVILNEKIITNPALSGGISESKRGRRLPNSIGHAPSFTRRTTIIWKTGSSTRSIHGPIGCFPSYSTKSRIRLHENMSRSRPAATSRQNRI